jgi:hypothetical protein
MKKKMLLAVVVLAALLACDGAGDCGREDGCFGDGDFDGKAPKTEAPR